MSFLRESNEGLFLTVRVAPRSDRDEITGIHGDALKIRLNAPPVEGKANDRLVRFLGEHLKIPSAQIQIIRGFASREKRLIVTGLKSEELLKRLGPVGRGSVRAVDAPTAVQAELPEASPEHGHNVKTRKIKHLGRSAIFPNAQHLIVRRFPPASKRDPLRPLNQPTARHYLRRRLEP